MFSLNRFSGLHKLLPDNDSGEQWVKCLTNRGEKYVTPDPGLGWLPAVTMRLVLYFSQTSDLSRYYLITPQ